MEATHASWNVPGALRKRRISLKAGFTYITMKGRKTVQKLTQVEGNNNVLLESLRDFI